MKRASLLLVLLAGLLLRVVYLGQAAAMPFFDNPVGDDVFYLKRASEILRGGFIPDRPFFYGSVLYPYFLAAVLWLPGGSLFLVGLLQAIAGTLLAYLISRIARRIYGGAAGMAAAVLAALYGPFAFLESDILGVIWGLVAVAAGVLWCLRIDAGGGVRLRYALLAGAAFGLSAAERPNLLLLIPLAVLWAAWPPGEGKGAGPGSWRGAKAGAALLVGAAIAFSPVILLNRAAAGRWVLLNTSRGINLYIGNSPGADGTYDEPWSKSDPQFTARYTYLQESSLMMASRLAGRALDQEEASAYWTGRALEFIRDHPLDFLKLTLRKAALLWNAAEIPNHLEFPFMKREAWGLRLMPVGFGAVAPLAAAGVAFALFSRKRRRETWLLVLVACGAAASVLPFFVAERYRAPMVPPLIAAAGFGAVALFRAFRDAGSRRDWRLGAALLPALALGAVSQLPLTHPDMSRGHWLLAQAYRAKGDLAGARVEYEAAVAEAGEDGILLNNLARVYRAMGLRSEAESALRRAIQAAPGLAYPHKNLGLLFIEEGRKDEALEEIEASLKLEPSDAEAFGALAALRAERGEKDAAVAAYGKARRLDSADPRLARLLEMYPYLGGEGATSPPARP